MRFAARAGLLRVLALLCALVPVFAGNAAYGQGAVRSVHQEWQIRCDTPPGRMASNAP